MPITFTEAQKERIIRASNVEDAAGEIMLAIFDAPSRSEKLRMLEDFHRLQMQVIDLLGEVGDPSHAKKTELQQNNYATLKRGYEALGEDGRPPMTPERAAARAFEDARLAIVREHNGASRAAKEETANG